MAEAQSTRLHLGLLILGILFFVVHLAARYYIVVVLDPIGAVTPAMISMRDNLFQMGIITSAASLILPAAGFPKDESKIIHYLFSLTAITYTLGLYIDFTKSPVGQYLVYNTGAILIILSAVMLLGYLGIRGRMIRSDETERIALVVLALMLVLNLAIALWIFNPASSGRQVSITVELLNLDILRDHSMRYAVWTVLAAFIMKFSRPNSRLYRLTILGLVTATIIWTITFAGYTFGAQIQITPGIMDTILGVSILASILSLWGLKGKRSRITPHFTLGSVALIWLIIAGAVGLYMTSFFIFQDQALPLQWRVFHLMNANWSLTAGLAAVALASARHSGKISWIATLLLSAGMVKMIASYLVNVFDPSAAAVSLRIGEPFLLTGLLVVAYLLFNAERKSAT